jgi:hypothetical protein
MRKTLPAIARRLALTLVVALAPSMPAFGQSPPANRPSIEADPSGHGAVLCGWWIYLIV